MVIFQSYFDSLPEGMFFHVFFCQDLSGQNGEMAVAVEAGGFTSCAFASTHALPSNSGWTWLKMLKNTEAIYI